MESTEFSNLVQTFEKLSHLTALKWNKEFKKMPINQMFVLSNVKQHGRIKSSDVAKNLGITPGAITGLADHLVKKGYLRRVGDEHDRRIQYLQVTEEGHQIIKEAADLGIKIREDLFKVLDADELESLMVISTKLLKTLEKDFEKK